MDQRDFLFVVAESLFHLGECDILLDIGNRGPNSLTLLGIGDDHDEATLHPSDPVTLVTHVFDLDSSGFAFLNWRSGR
jgi:hypothetical protein